MNDETQFYKKIYSTEDYWLLYIKLNKIILTVTLNKITKMRFCSHFHFSDKVILKIVSFHFRYLNWIF